MIIIWKTLQPYRFVPDKVTKIVYEKSLNTTGQIGLYFSAY